VRSESNGGKRRNIASSLRLATHSAHNPPLSKEITIPNPKSLNLLFNATLLPSSLTLSSPNGSASDNQRRRRRRQHSLLQPLRDLALPAAQRARRRCRVGPQ